MVYLLCIQTIQPGPLVPIQERYLVYATMRPIRSFPQGARLGGPSTQQYRAQFAGMSKRHTGTS
jgi:hypothetical protein